MNHSKWIWLCDWLQNALLISAKAPVPSIPVAMGLHLLWLQWCHSAAGNLICTSQSQETLSQATFGVVSKLGSISLGWVSEIHPEEGDLDWFVCIGTAWWQYFRMSSRSWQRLCYKQSCKEATIKGKKKHGKKMMGELMSQGTWRLPKMLCQHLPASPVFISWSFLLRQGELFL